MRTPGGRDLGGERDRARLVGAARRRARAAGGSGGRSRGPDSAHEARRQCRARPSRRARRTAIPRPRRPAGAARSAAREERQRARRRPRRSVPTCEPRPRPRPATASATSTRAQQRRRPAESTGRCRWTASTRHGHAGDEDRDAVGDRRADRVHARDQREREPEVDDRGHQPGDDDELHPPEPVEDALADPQHRLQQQRREHRQQDRAGVRVLLAVGQRSSAGPVTATPATSGSVASTSSRIARQKPRRMRSSSPMPTRFATAGMLTASTRLGQLREPGDRRRRRSSRTRSARRSSSAGARTAPSAARRRTG